MHQKHIFSVRPNERDCVLYIYTINSSPRYPYPINYLTFYQPVFIYGILHDRYCFRDTSVSKYPIYLIKLHYLIKFHYNVKIICYDLAFPRFCQFCGISLSLPEFWFGLSPSKP